MTSKNSSQNVTIGEMKTHVEEVHDHSWEINYDGAQCKFESSSPEDAVIYDLEVPEQARNQGIGTAMVKTAEKIVREKTGAKVMHAQIGASDGSTRHVLHRKCGFEILGEDYQETLGKIIDATKKLD
jgi:GNAT superfamily N-acetyltransferase